MSNPVLMKQTIIVETTVINGTIVSQDVYGKNDDGQPFRDEAEAIEYAAAMDKVEEPEELTQYFYEVKTVLVEVGKWLD